MDNLNTQEPRLFYEAFRSDKVETLWDRFEFVYNRNNKNAKVNNTGMPLKRAIGYKAVQLARYWYYKKSLYHRIYNYLISGDNLIKTLKQYLTKEE